MQTSILYVAYPTVDGGGMVARRETRRWPMKVLQFMRLWSTYGSLRSAKRVAIYLNKRVKVRHPR